MSESMWGAFIVGLGVVSIFFIYAFQSVTNTNEHNYNMLKEVTEAAMLDAVSLPDYRRDAVIRIDREKFVENFVRRFAESANLGRTYDIKIYDVVELPPKVSLQVSSREKGNTEDKVIVFDIVNRIDAILETPY